MDKKIIIQLSERVTVKIMAAIAGIIIGIAVALCPPLQGLDVNAMSALGVLSWAISWWIFDVIPEYVIAMLMCALFVILQLVPNEIAFATFSGSTWWMLLGALGLGAAIAKSGLLARIALITLRFFPKSFKGQIIGFLGVGFITAPFVPSLSAKIAMLAPVSLAMSDALGYKRKGQEANALFLAMFTGVRNMAPVFLSASVIGYLLHGMYPPSIQAQFNMGYWFLCALPWGITISILNYFTIIAMYSPKIKKKVEIDYINDQIARLGPMNSKEKIMLWITLLTVFMWATEPWHGVPPHLVALVGLCLAIASGVFDRAGFRALIPWESLIFIGAVMNLSPVFKALYIDNWIISLFGPIMQQLTANPYLFVMGIALITVLVRFVIVSDMAYISIFMVFLVPLVMQAGINPWVAGMVVYVVVTPWLVFYQNPLYLVAHYATNGEMVEFSEMARFCVIYLINSLLALLISVPFWQYMKLLP